MARSGVLIESARSLRTQVTCGLAIAFATVVAISSTTGIGVGGSWFDEHRILSLVALVMAALACCLTLRVPRDSASIAVLVILGLGLVSVAGAARPYAAAIDWSVYCLIALLVLTAQSHSHLAVSLSAALVGGIVPAAYVTGVTANYLSSVLLGFPVGAETLLVGFSNPRFPAHLQVLTIPLLPMTLRLAPAGLWKGCIAAVAAVWWMCFIGSGSRTGWIALAAVSLFLLSFGAAGRQWLRAQVVFAAAGAVLWLVLFVGVPGMLDVPAALEAGRLANFASVGARRILLSISADAVLAHPLLGIGPMHFAYVNNGQGAHPHNFWLQLAAEWGLPAALLAAGLAVGFFVRLVRAVRQEPDPTRRSDGIALVAAVAAWGIGVIADGYMVVPTSQLMSAVVLMLGVMWLRLTSQPSGIAAHSRFLECARISLCGIAMSVLIALPFTAFGQPALRERAWRVEHPGQWLWPRFWQQGWIGPNDDPTTRQDPFRGWREK